MKLRALDWLVCPECRKGLRLEDAVAAPAHPSDEVAPLSSCGHCWIPQSPDHQRAGVERSDCAACYGMEILSGSLVCDGGHSFADEGSAQDLVCDGGHSFAITEGVPRFAAGTTSRPDAGSSAPRDPDAIRASFSREWGHFDYEDRTWALELDARCDLVLKELGVDAADLQGKILFDAGCGNGSLSRGLNRFGCEVVGVDVSDAVLRAWRHFASRGNDRTHFLQGDLMRLPLKPESFDYVYSSGVLHHNPDTYAALQSVLRTLKPGGRVYMWVYHPIPGWQHWVKQRFRAVVAPLPQPLKYAIVAAWSTQSMARQGLRRLLGRARSDDDLRWRERLVLLLDHYTPRYRWEHTQAEVHEWYRGLGLEGIETTDVREWGFGVVGTKPEPRRPGASQEAE